jgi:GTPase SAR1 family protein
LLCKNAKKIISVEPLPQAIPILKKNIEKYSPLVKSRGIIGGHDFRNYSEKGGEEIFGVFKAIMEWILKRREKLFVNNDWWMIKDE